MGGIASAWSSCWVRGRRFWPGIHCIEGHSDPPVLADYSWCSPTRAHVLWSFEFCCACLIFVLLSCETRKCPSAFPSISNRTLHESSSCGLCHALLCIQRFTRRPGEWKFLQILKYPPDIDEGELWLLQLFVLLAVLFTTEPLTLLLGSYMGIWLELIPSQQDPQEDLLCAKSPTKWKQSYGGTKFLEKTVQRGILLTVFLPRKYPENIFPFVSHVNHIECCFLCPAPFVGGRQ